MRLSLVAGLILMVALSARSVVYADESTDLAAFNAANSLYEAGSYEEAARSYQHLVGLGYEDATLYYNLGNAYYKMDEIGRRCSVTCGPAVWPHTTGTYRPTSRWPDRRSKAPSRGRRRYP